MTVCPVCNITLKKFELQGDRGFYECPCCGPYSMSSSARQEMPWLLQKFENGSAKLSHALYYMTKKNLWALITTDLLRNILENTELPRPQEQLENLIIWIGESQPSMGATIDVKENTISAVGVTNYSSLEFLVLHAIDTGLLKGEVRKPPVVLSRSICLLQLTMAGWSLFEELKRGKSRSHIAFMAMQFGDELLDRLYKEFFKKAVAATGFDLKRVDEGQPAGLIDDRLRIEIRQSRFLIADLTHHNRGAYWEAGYAEGLGKPVIYTCRKDEFEDKSMGTHFDTNHHLTVVWELDKIDEAIEMLKATIRATLPEDSILMD